MTAASPWSEWPDTLIEVDTETGREVHHVDLRRHRVRYYAKRLVPAAKTEIAGQLGAAPAAEPAGDFGPSTDFADL